MLDPGSSALVQLTHLSKSYGGVHALEDVDLEIAPGEVHALCGENGAGKSTLIKVLTGVTTPEGGEVLVQGQPLALGQVHSAEAVGIAVMHQESTAFPHLNAVDNIFVGRELTKRGGWLLNRAEMRRRTQALLDRLGESVNLAVPIGDLPLAQRQIVALARALARDCRLLIMDEPTASLSARETERLLDIIRHLRRDGVSVLYVSHRLEEIFQIADRVTVLRDGRRVVTRPVTEVSREQLIHWMVGRETDELLSRHTRTTGTGGIVLDVRGLTRARAFQSISFSVRAGETVGLAGLVGAGRSELARALFGIEPYDEGSVWIESTALPRGSVPAAMAAGLALVPEDRQHEGLVLPMTVGQNLSLAKLRHLRHWGFIRRRAESELVDEQMRALTVKAGGPHVAAETLSGGNQQKLVLGKWLATQPKVLLLDEPTRGIDVGAKAQVHRLIRRLAEQGVAILLISSELPELLSLSDRILVMRGGRISGVLEGTSATQEQILQFALPDVPGTVAS